MPHNEEKEKREERILEQYLRLRPELSKMARKRSDRPDFILFDNDSRIGIEVTELITEEDGVLRRIVLDHADSHYSAETIHENAKLKHGSKADNYTYREISGVSFVGTLTLNITERKKKHRDQILRKIDKYYNVIPQYSNFIILCDATMGIDITSEYEAEQVISDVNEAMHEQNAVRVIIAILYKDGCGHVFCTEQSL